MKFVFMVLLVACALSASASAQKHLLLNKFDNSPRRFQNWIGDSVREASLAVNDIVKEFILIVPKTEYDISKSLERADPQFEDVLRNIRITANQNETAKECAEQHRQAVRDIIGNAKKEFAVCRENARNEFQDIKNKTQEQSDAIRSQVNILREIFRDCRNSSRNPFETYLCLAQEAEEIGTSISTIISNVEDAVVISNKEIGNILSNGSRCASQNIANTKSQIDEVFNQIATCIAKNSDGQDSIPE